MSGRPEGHSGGWEDHRPTGDDLTDGWQPWRPGDPPVTDERPSVGAGDVGTVDRGPIRRAARADQDRPGRERGQPADVDREPRRGWQWTEPQPERYDRGDRVRATHTTGGDFISHVPKGTEGRVVDTRLGVLGEKYATVEFTNGYTEEVKTSDIERRGWW